MNTEINKAHLTQARAFPQAIAETQVNTKLPRSVRDLTDDRINLQLSVPQVLICQNQKKTF